MSLPRALFVLLGAALVSTGCLGDADVSPPTGAGPSAPSAASNATVATPSAPAAAGAPPVVIPVSYSGTTSKGACVGTVVVPGVCQIDSGEGWSQQLPAHPNGTSLTLDANVTWEASSPASKTLSVQLAVQHESGGWGTASDFPQASGESPLRLAWDLTPYQGRRLALGVWGSSHVGTPAGGPSVYAEQTFHVEGMLVSVQG